MPKKLLTRSAFARLAGVNPSTTTRLCKTLLAPAWNGKHIDAAHPAAVAYLKKREDAPTPSDEPAPATGIDPMYEPAVKFCADGARYSISSIQREFRIGYNRAKRIIETMKANGVIPENTDPATGKVNTPTYTEEEFKEKLATVTPKLRGNAAANQTKKSLALAEANARQEADINAGMLHEVPEDIQAFADMTLRELIERFGTDTAFIDWLKATKSIEDINEKRLKNAQTKGELISRKLVKDHVIDTFNSAHLRLMKDGSKSIAAGVVSKHAGGADLPEVEAYVSDIVGSFIKPIKNKISRVLKNA